MDHTAEWRTQGYDIPPASAEFLRPPGAEFLRAYHFTSSQHGVNALALSRLKVARFSDANDPFELLALNCHGREVRRRASMAKDAFNEVMGLLCFTKDWSSPLIWSHYADRHRGVCLGFDVRRTILATVEYEDDRLREDLPDDPDPAALDPDLQARLARTKSHHWKYEQEVRVFLELDRALNEHGLYFRPFDNDLRLAEVILGQQCALPVSAMRALVADHAPAGAQVLKARLAFRSFNVRPDGRFRPLAS